MPARYNPTNEILQAIVNLDQGQRIIAAWKDGTTAEYSAYMLDLLKSDSFLDYVYDAETGEILYNS